MKENENLITVSQFAELVGYQTSTVLRLTRKPNCPAPVDFAKQGSIYVRRFDREELMAFWNSHRHWPQKWETKK